MFLRNPIRAIALAAALLVMATGAQAFDDALYPDLKGQWLRIPAGNPRFDPTKQRGLQQRAPLTAEFQAAYEASLADQAAGGQGNHLGYICAAWGMPAMMNLYDAMEIVVLPGVTYVLIDDVTDSVRRIFTDGRDWPTDAAPTYAGYSIGRWIDSDGDGRFDVLEVETRNFKGPRVYDNTGLMLHPDNKSVVRERIFLNPSKPGILQNQVTVIDNALTHPWTVMKSYRREPEARPYWRENGCGEGSNHVRIGNENYFLSADGHLMPTKKDQPPPDLKHFHQAPK